MSVTYAVRPGIEPASSQSWVHNPHSRHGNSWCCILYMQHAVMSRDAIKHRSPNKQPNGSIPNSKVLHFLRYFQPLRGSDSSVVSYLNCLVRVSDMFYYKELYES